MNKSIYKSLLVFFFSILTCHKAYVQDTNEISGLLNSLKSTPDSLKPKVYSRIGFYYFSRDIFDSAMFYINQSLLIAKKLDNRKEIANAYNNIGTLYRMRSDFPEALEYYSKSLETYELINDYIGVAKVYGNMGVAYGEQMQINKAIEMCINSSLFFKKGKDTLSLITSYINLVNGYSSLSDFKKSRKYLDTALLLLSYKEKNGFLSQDDSAHTAYASMYLQKTLALQLHNERKFDSSIMIYKAVIRATTAGSGALNLVDLMRGLAESYIETKQYDSALVYMNSAVNVLKTDSIPESYKSVYKILATVYEKQGRYKEALEAHKLYKTFNDSITNSQNYRTIANLNAKHEAKKKDETILQLGKERRSQRIVIGLASVAALIAIALMAFAFRSRKLQKKLFNQKEELLLKEKEIETTRLKNRMTELEQMALRAQMNPHFIFNSLNSVQHFVMNKDVEGVNKYLGAFANLIRQTLNNSGRQLISLDEEVKYLDTYLSLEKMKSNNSFNYAISISENIDRTATFIPGMILQPFVENSIRHGVSHKEKNDGFIHISISKNEKLLCLVEDNGIGRQKAGEIKLTGEGSEYESKGMTITMNRIDTFNKMYGIAISARVEDVLTASGTVNGTRVIIDLPADME